MSLPRRGFAFSEAILALTGHRVLPFNRNAPEDLDLLGRLGKAAEMAARAAAKEGIATARPNEAGNAIEPFVESALRSVGLITRDALHLVVGFELKKSTTEGRTDSFQRAGPF